MASYVTHPAIELLAICLWKLLESITIHLELKKSDTSRLDLCSK